MEVSEQVGHFTCDACGRRYTWKAQLAGRKVRCGCGQVMVAPLTPPHDEELYDLAPDLSARPMTARLDALPAVIPATTLPATTPALSYGRPLPEESRIHVYFPDRVRDLYMPLALIGGGTVIEFGAAMFMHGGSFDAAARYVGYAGIGMLVNTLLLLVAIFLVAKMRDITFGPLPTAILKLCAISIAPGAAAVFFRWLPLGSLIGLVVSFILYFALIGALFDLDESDTWACVFTAFVVKLLVVFAVIGYMLQA